MIDPGSDTNFIRHEFAEALGLQGEDYQLRLKVVDREARSLDTKKYTMEVEDKYGNHHTVLALGLESITVLPPDPDLSPIKELVEHLPGAVLDRPQGRVDILLGLKNSALHGRTVAQWENLRLLESPIGCGWSLRGSHPGLSTTGQDVSTPGQDVSTPGQGVSTAGQDVHWSSVHCSPQGSRRDGEYEGSDKPELRDEGKLGRLGGRPDPPSRPLLHEDKLPGLVAGGQVVCRLRQEGKLVLLHEVKLCQDESGQKIEKLARARIDVCSTLLLLLLLLSDLSVWKSKPEIQAIYVLLLLLVWVQKVCTKFGIAVEFYKYSQRYEALDINYVRKGRNGSCGLRELKWRATGAESPQEIFISCEPRNLKSEETLNLASLDPGFYVGLPDMEDMDMEDATNQNSEMRVN